MRKRKGKIRERRYNYQGENRESVNIKDVPERLKQAFIATRDRRFNEHSGVDLRAIGRALVTDIVHMSAVEGGSTITQQLAKNVFLSSEKTAFRKGTEMSIAFALDERFTKDEILEKYLNRIFFGSNAYGIKAAAKVYFGKSNLNDLRSVGNGYTCRFTESTNTILATINILIYLKNVVRLFSD